MCRQAGRQTRLQDMTGRDLPRSHHRLLDPVFVFLVASGATPDLRQLLSLR